jgi:hypothetical protein
MANFVFILKFLFFVCLTFGAGAIVGYVLRLNKFYESGADKHIEKENQSMHQQTAA